MMGPRKIAPQKEKKKTWPMEYKPPLRKWNITNTKGIYIRIPTRNKIKKFWPSILLKSSVMPKYRDGLEKRGSKIHRVGGCCYYRKGPFFAVQERERG
jgi:hypothetical protein